MFDLNLKNGKLDIQRFEPFMKEGGKLPSFSVAVHSLNQQQIKVLKTLRQVGDYTFFEKRAGSFWFSFCGCYCRLSEDFTHADVYLSEQLRPDGDYEASNLLMQAYMYRLADTGNFMIHSAAVNFNHNAVLFCGLSGAGKSTQANLWKEYLHADILNYDKPCIINENETFYAHGSPWSGKEALYRNEYAPLKAIVFVKQAKENRVVRLSPGQAYAHIFLHNYVYPLTEEVEKKYAAAISETAMHIPIYELYCDISETAVYVLFSELFPEKNFLSIKKEYAMKYRIKDSFEMKEIADEYIVIPRGSKALSYNATMVFNDSGAFLFKHLGNYIDLDSLSELLSKQFSISLETALEDTTSFIEKMKANGLLDIID